MAASGSKITFVPPPHEQGYYDALFSAADVNRTGALGGAEAVQFFTRSKLPVDVLKSVWTLADQPPSNSLDKAKFSVAVRLIQLMQNGQKGQGPNLAAPQGVTLRPVMFEGVSGVSVPLPPPPGAGPPPQQQQQQQQYPPQQQQRGPTPQPPGSAMGPPPPSPGGSAYGSTALTVQDPYTLTPADQSRYEDIFPQYAKPDGFVYGKEAVELFSKSGMPQPQLAAIWSMVDTPVDNRLDKLEFAMAMHLIVCVSKKNLPMPASLPISLKQLKSQQAPQQQRSPQAATMPTPQQQPLPMPSPQRASPMPPQQQQQRQMPPPPMPSPQLQPQQQMQPPPPLNQPVGGALSIPSPSRGTSQMMMQQPTFQPQSQTGGSPSFSSSLSGPPPLAPTGGMNISDAFAGLDASGSGGGGGAGGPQDMQSYLANAPRVATAASFDTSHSIGMQQQQQPPPQLRSQPAQQLDETIKPVAQQPLPPAVVSVEEASHTSYYNETSAEQAPSKTTKQLAANYNMQNASEELNKLRETMQKLQAENISLKAQLTTVDEDEAATQKELAATVAEITKLSSQLTTLRAQVLASKSRLMETTAELKAAEEKRSVLQDLIVETKATKLAIDEATEEVEKTTEVVSKAGSVVHRTHSFENDLFGFDAPLPGSTAAPPPAPMASSTGSGDLPPPQFMTNAMPEVPAQKTIPEPAPQPETVTSQDSDLPPPSAMQHNYQQQPTTTTVDMFGLQAPAPAAGPSHQRNQPSFGGFEGDGIMGGTIGPSFATMAANASATTGASSGAPKAQKVLSNDEIDSLKSKSREADSVARDAEDSKRQVVAQMEELRRVADEAEKKARDHSKGLEGKKKGVFGRGKKRDAKEGEKLAQDAKTKKEAFLQAQAQVNDANALAEATRKEAEKLRKEIEDAEMEAATAASMAESTKATAAAPPAYPTNNGGYHMPSSYGMSPAPGGFGAMGGGEMNFNPNVMGSGSGISIPTPSGVEDYDNPFSS